MGARPLDLEGYVELAERRRDTSGILYTGRQVGFDREVGIKVPAGGSAPDLRALRDLSGHPNVVTVLDTGRTATGEDYLVFDYSAATSLADRPRASGPGDVEEALRIGAKLAAALVVAHGSGLVGWDMRPGSVLLSAYGEPQLAVCGRGGSDDVTTSEDVAFTPPEVLRGQPVTEAADVYSLAALVSTLATGRAPFADHPGEPLATTVTRACTGAPDGLPPAGVPGDVRDVLERALAKTPTERPDAVALGAVLADAASGRVPAGAATAEVAASVATAEAPPRPETASSASPATGQPSLTSPQRAGAAPSRPASGSRLALAVAGSVGAAVVIAVLGVLLLARGGGHETKPGTKPAAAGPKAEGRGEKGARPSPTSTTRAQSPGTEKLRAALLGLGDLPAGWAVAGNEVGSAGLPDADFCGVAPKVAGLLSEVRATYQAGPQGPYLFQAVGTFSPGGARQYMDSLVPAARSCTTWNDKLADGSNVLMTVSAQDATLGEQSFRFTMGGAIDGGGQVVQVVFFTRRGDTVSATSFAGAPDTVDAALAIDLETKADQKLLQALG